MTVLERTISIFSFEKRSQSRIRRSDFVFLTGLRMLALLVVVLFSSIIVFLYIRSARLIEQDGWGFLWNTVWNPLENVFGVLPFIYGTILTSILALLIAVPIAVASALFLTELAPPAIAKPVGFLIEMLAAIPSVVYGLWGIFILAPFVRVYVQPFLTSVFGFLPFFQGPAFGIGILTASLILSIMILPTIASVSREVFLAIPNLMREGALSLGATRWETIYIAVLKDGLPGIISAVILGLGRAMGETMAVTMLIGNRAVISSSLYSPGATMASVIANEYPEAGSDMHLSALTAVGLALFIVSLGVNVVARLIILRYKRARAV